MLIIITTHISSVVCDFVLAKNLTQSMSFYPPSNPEIGFTPSLVYIQGNWGKEKLTCLRS